MIFSVTSRKKTCSRCSTVQMIPAVPRLLSSWLNKDCAALKKIPPWKTFSQIRLCSSLYLSHFLFSYCCDEQLFPGNYASEIRLGLLRGELRGCWFPHNYGTSGEFPSFGLIIFNPYWFELNEVCSKAHEVAHSLSLGTRTRRESISFSTFKRGSSERSHNHNKIPVRGNHPPPNDRKGSKL